MLKLKKFASVLLVVLMLIASCFAFVACDESTDCVNGQRHYFSNDYGRCMHCHKKYCEAYGEHSYTNGYCEYCGESKSEAEKASDGESPIGTILGVGFFLLIASLISHRIGIAASSPFFIRAPMVVFLVFTVGTFFAYNVLCGIIMSIFFILYTIGSVSMNRKYLGYDDVL